MLLINHLVLWQELAVNNATHIKEHDPHHFVLPSLAISESSNELKHWVPGSYSNITSDDSIKQVWFSLKMLTDVLTHLHVALLLIIILQSWYDFCTDFLHVQIFGDNLPNTVFFHVQLTCDHLNSQLMIATHQLPYPLKINLSPAC